MGLQTTGARVGTVVACIANIGTAIVLSFIWSWKLTLVTLAIMPLVAIGGAIEIKVMQGYAGANQGALEEAGKVRYLKIPGQKVTANS